MTQPTYPKKVPNPQGNPNFRPKWKHKTIAMRLPADFEHILYDVARLLDEGILTENDLERLIVSKTKDQILDEVVKSLNT